MFDVLTNFWNLCCFRRIENPRIMLLDCNLEYKKGESQTNLEITKEDDFALVLLHVHYPDICQKIDLMSLSLGLIMLE